MVGTVLTERTERTKPYYVGEVAIRGSAIMYVCSCCLDAVRKKTNGKQ